MPARSLAAKMSAAFLVLFVTLLLLPLGEGCAATCSSSSDCSDGDLCLFSPGSGCSAKGHCGQHESCVAQTTGTTLCSCLSGVSINIFCAPSDGIAEPTTNGACPASTEGTSEAGASNEAGTTADATTEAGATTDAGGTPDAEAVVDAGGQ